MYVPRKSSAAARWAPRIIRGSADFILEHFEAIVEQHSDDVRNETEMSAGTTTTATTLALH